MEDHKQMKKKITAIIAILLCVVICFSLSACLTPKEITVSLLFPFMMCASYGETLLETSTSPDGTYTLDAYLTNGGATTDFGIKVYQHTLFGNKLIYHRYHKDTVSIRWDSDSIAVINGVKLDLSKGETYKNLER